MNKKEEQLEELKVDSWIRKNLTNTVKIAISLIVFIAGVVAPYYSIKQDVALIKENHYAHIEAINKNIEKNSTDIKETEIKQEELMKIIIANQTKLDLLMK